jgi:hypothetical protein
MCLNTHHQAFVGPPEIPRPQAWHREAMDAAIRASTIQEIFDLLKARSPDKSDSSMRDMAQRFDTHLYNSAASLEAYACRTTLWRRIFAYVLSTRSGDACCAACGGTTAPLSAEAPSRGARVCAAGAGCCGAGREPSELLREQQGRILVMRQLSRCTAEGEGERAAACYNGVRAILPHHFSDCRDPACAVPGCLPTRSAIRHFTACLYTQCPLCAPVRATIRTELADNVRVTGAGASATPVSEQRVDMTLVATGMMPRYSSGHLLPSCVARGSKRQRDEGAASDSPWVHSRRCRGCRREEDEDRGAVGGISRHSLQALARMWQRMTMKGYIFEE